VVHGPPGPLQPQKFVAWLHTPSQQSVLGCVGGGLGSQIHASPLGVQLLPLEDPLELPPEPLEASCPASTPLPDELPLEPPLPLLLLAPLLLALPLPEPLPLPLPLLPPLPPPVLLPLPVLSAVPSSPPSPPPPVPCPEPLDPHASMMPAAKHPSATTEGQRLLILSSYDPVRACPSSRLARKKPVSQHAIHRLGGRRVRVVEVETLRRRGPPRRVATW
jgi:hypothetical protein